MRSGTRLRVAILAAPAAILALAVGGHGCGSARKIDEGTPRGASALALELQSLELPAAPGADGPRVTFRATDASGAPIDVLAELANASSRTVPYLSIPRFTLAQVEADGSTTSWYEASVAPKAFTPPAGVTPAPGTATQPGLQQATAETLAERIKANGDGTYTFVLGPPTTAAARRDPAKTLVVGMWAERVAPRSTGGAKRWPAAATRTFLQGSGTPAAPHEAVSDAACNTCHVTMRAHDRRETVQLCKTCHSGSADAPYRDPESNENLDFRVMIHRIHAGATLPSVRSGGKFYIVGRNQTVHDFSTGEFPPLREATDCTACHQGGANADAWKTRASFTACTSCHDGVRFDGTAGAACALGTDEAAPCDHPLSPALVSAGSDCASCHAAGTSSPPIGPDVAHRNETLALASRWGYEILQVTVGEDRMPVVRFRVTKDGAPNDIKTDAAWTQGGGASRLFVDVAWPATEITNEGAGYVDATVRSAQFPAGTPGQGLPVQINALTAATPVPGEPNVFEVKSPTAIPTGFGSARVVLEGHPAEGALRIPVANAVRDVTLGSGSAAARRQIVSAETCNACHGSISAHGANRNQTPDACVACHTPRATDFVRRVQADPTAPPATEAPIDFKILIHQIHAADIRRTKTTVLGFGGAPHEFPAAFPGQTGRCTICHVGDSYQLPLPAEALDVTRRVGDPTRHDPAADPGEQREPRTMAVCASCHDAVRFDAAPELPACNTLVPVNSAACRHTGGPQADEAGCASCHGKGGAFDVAKVHPIAEKPQ